MYSIFKRSTAITFNIIYYMSKYYHNYLHKQPSKVGCFILVYLDRFLGIAFCVFQTQKHLSYHRTIHTRSFNIFSKCSKSVSASFSNKYLRKSRTACFVDLLVVNASFSSTILLICNVDKSSFVYHVDRPAGILVCHVLCEVIAPDVESD